MNPYLEKYPQSEVESLISSGSLIPNLDSHANLCLERNCGSVYSSSITIPLVNYPVDSTKVETKYNVEFTEL